MHKSQQSLDNLLIVVDGWMGRNADIKDGVSVKYIMSEPLLSDRVFDLPVDELEPHPAYDFFAPAPLPGYAGNLNNNNGWLKADDYLLGELEAMVDEQMVVPAIKEVVEPIAEAEEEQVIAPIVDIEEEQMDAPVIDMRRTWPRCSAMMILRMMHPLSLAMRRSER
ncbi:hypothetical protein Tco_1062252 [Tanacetum coccineum]